MVEPLAGVLAGGWVVWRGVGAGVVGEGIPLLPSPLPRAVRSPVAVPVSGVAGCHVVAGIANYSQFVCLSWQCRWA